MWVRTEPPSWASPRARVLWDTTFLCAEREYGPMVKDWGTQDSVDTANTALRNLERRGVTEPSEARFPDPGDLAAIGVFIEVDVVQADGTILACGFKQSDRIPMLWSPSLRAVFVYPGVKDFTCDTKPTPQLRRVIRTWTRGRQGARCASERTMPRPAIVTKWPAIAVTYFSTKFGSPKRYIHHHDPGVWASRSAGKSPCIMIRGGRLRLTSDGLAG